MEDSVGGDLSTSTESVQEAHLAFSGFDWRPSSSFYFSLEGGVS